MLETIFDHEMPLQMDENTERAFASIVRAEDVQFSPAGDRLVIADILGNAIIVFSVWFDKEHVFLSDPSRISASEIDSPHGVAWVSEDLIAVANRDTGVTFHNLQNLQTGLGAYPSMLTLTGLGGHIVTNPGCVRCLHRENGFLELFVCDNENNFVSQHLIKLDNEKLTSIKDRCFVGDDFKLPDGLMVSANQKTLFVSDHFGHRVLGYELGDFAPNKIIAEIKNCDYPHGIAEHIPSGTIFIAGAGARLVYVASRPGKDWVGTTAPVYSFEVLTDQQFRPKHINPEDGGPKGLAISADGEVLAVSSEARPLSFYSIPSILTQAGIKSDRPIEPVVSSGYQNRYEETSNRTIEILSRQLGLMVAEKNYFREKLTLMEKSESMRLTLPLRLISRAIKKLLGIPLDY